MVQVKIEAQLLAERYQRVPARIAIGRDEEVPLKRTVDQGQRQLLKLEVEVHAGRCLRRYAQIVFIHDRLQQAPCLFQGPGQSRIGRQLQACAINVQGRIGLAVQGHPGQRFGQLLAVLGLFGQFCVDHRFAAPIIVKAWETAQGF